MQVEKNGPQIFMVLFYQLKNTEKYSEFDSIQGIFRYRCLNCWRTEVILCSVSFNTNISKKSLLSEVARLSDDADEAAQRGGAAVSLQSRRAKKSDTNNV